MKINFVLECTYQDLPSAVRIRIIIVLVLMNLAVTLGGLPVLGLLTRTA